MAESLVSIGKLADEVQLSVGWLRHLADAGTIPFTRSPGGHRRFDVVAVRKALAARQGVPPDPRTRAGAGPTAEPVRAPDWERRLHLDGLEEHAVWAAVRADLALDTSTNAGRILQHAFNQMLDNAIDHSGGFWADIAVWSGPQELATRIRDDGRGIFAHLREHRNLRDDREAVAELMKGKVTTMPDRHTGEGIFFTSRAADLFQVTSGRLRWTVDNARSDQALGEAPDAPGTVVYVQVHRGTTRTLQGVFSAFTEDHEFVRSRPSVRPFGQDLAFVSRSEARRLLDGMEHFAEIEVDFEGVTEVGQAFVDEVFRVWPSQHPGSSPVPVNMNEAVEFMVRRSLPPAGRE